MVSIWRTLRSAAQRACVEFGTSVLKDIALNAAAIPIPPAISTNIDWSTEPPCLLCGRIGPGRPWTHNEMKRLAAVAERYRWTLSSPSGDPRRN